MFIYLSMLYHDPIINSDLLFFDPRRKSSKNIYNLNLFNNIVECRDLWLGRMNFSTMNSAKSLPKLETTKLIDEPLYTRNIPVKTNRKKLQNLFFFILENYEIFCIAYHFFYLDVHFSWCLFDIFFDNTFRPG